MEIVEAISEAAAAPPSDLYLPAMIGVIDPRNASQVIQILSDKLPLEMYGLRHLKRARKSLQNSELELVICPESVAENALTDEMKSLFQDIRVVNVCRYKPQSRAEFKEWGESWPIIFRPTELSEERERGLPLTDIQNIQGHLSSLFKQDPNSNSIQDRDGIIVNPVQNEVVISADQVREYLNQIPRYASRSISANPLYSFSPTLLCIEGVAALVRGEEIPSGSKSLSDQQYVCTGLDLYLYSEPDMMSAMALVHSRIRRVIYLHRDPLCGALGSVFSLHELRSINHRFRVYRVNNA